MPRDDIEQFARDWRAGLYDEDGGAAPTPEERERAIDTFVREWRAGRYAPASSPPTPAASTHGAPANRSADTGPTHDPPAAAASADTNARLYPRVAGELGNDLPLLEMLQAYLGLNPAQQASYLARMDAAPLRAWLAGKGANWLAQLVASYKAWLTSRIGAPRGAMYSSFYTGPLLRQVYSKTY